MGKLFDKTFRYKIRITKNKMISVIDIITFIIITLFAIGTRLCLFEFVSGDYSGFLSPWFDSLKAAGGIKGIGLSLGDYTPPYIYLMSLLTYLPLKSLFSIKLLSCIFDFIMAIFLMKLVYQKWQNNICAITVYGIVLFFPTVLFNSAFWAQCDVIYTSFLVISIYYFIKDKPLAGIICFSVAFSFKLQAIFIAPLLILFFLNRKIKLRYFLAIPIVYLLSILPAFIAGRPISELLTIYFSQSGQYKKLSLNAPNLYIPIGEDQTIMLSITAIILCATAVLLSLYILYTNRINLTKEAIVNAVLFFAILVPYLLPHMHERYFYPEDIFSLVYAFYHPKRFYIPILVVYASFAGYIPFLFGHTPIDLNFAAILMMIALVITAFDLFRLPSSSKKNNNSY